MTNIGIIGGMIGLKTKKYRISRIIKSLFHSLYTDDFGLALLIALIWQAIMTTVGAVFDATTDNLVREGAFSGDFKILDHMLRWDAGWYLEIIKNGYSQTGSPAAPAFYPVFPLAISVLTILTFGQIDILILALLLNTVCLWLSLTALIKISKMLMGTKYYWVAVALFLTSPAAIFIHMFYTEAIFTALAFWAYLFALRRQWAFMGFTLAILTACRIPSLLFVGLCGLEFLRNYNWSVKASLNKNILWFFMAPVGFLLYGTYLYFVQGDFLAMFHAYDKTNDWVYQNFNPNIFETLVDVTGGIVAAANNRIPFDEPLLVNIILPLAGLSILLFTSLWATFVVRKQFVPLGLLGFAAFIMFTLNGNVVSVHRYILPILTIYLVVTYVVKTSPKLMPLVIGAIYGSTLIQSLLLLLFINAYFAG